VAVLPDAPQNSTPAASAAIAQMREGGGPDLPDGEAKCPGVGQDFEIGPGVERGAAVRPYERAADDPLYRPLRIYTLDPAASRLEGAVAVVNVPYEPLEPGPAGSVLRVTPRDGDSGERYRVAELDAPAVLIRNGYDPSPADPRFHAQMVYAVASLTYAAFRHALGRHVPWGFDPHPQDAAHQGTRLRVLPFGGEERNAAYEPGDGVLRFGYFTADGPVAGRNVPGGTIFTCLSHDVVAHETAHALIDGLRSRFLVPTGGDALGFHEGFADLVAIFQHFSYPDVVRAAIRHSSGRLGRAALLTDLARQFGHTTRKDGKALRSAITLDAEGRVKPSVYAPDLEVHDMGSVLVSAVFSAFLVVYERKTERYLRLATAGTGILPEGELPADLQAVLADEASQLASQFLTVCIRAIDYCPPVDLSLGEFLRAVLTADYDLVPDDPWGYREAWIDAFGAHGIYPPHVRSLAEDELRWKRPAREIRPVDKLSFAELKFDGDPGRPSSAGELRRQACALGMMVRDNLDQFGLAAQGDEALKGDTVELPIVQSIRSSRRVGPDGQVVFDLVAEVTQRRNASRGFPMYGGATVILGPTGDVRYVIAKNVLNEERMERQARFVEGAGARFWRRRPDGVRRPVREVFRLLHAEGR